MITRRAEVERAVVALSVVTFVLAAAFGLIVLEPKPILKPVTETSTVTVSQTVTSTATPTQQAVETIDDDFAEHLLTFSSRNVSAILSQYEPAANMTWNGLFCWSGTYSDAGSGSGQLILLLNEFFGYTHVPFFAPFESVWVGNATLLVTKVADGSVMLNSTFGLIAQSERGNLTATISAQESYTQSATNDIWLISHEMWDFDVISNVLPPNVLNCIAPP